MISSLKEVISEFIYQQEGCFEKFEAFVILLMFSQKLNILHFDYKLYTKMYINHLKKHQSGFQVV